MQLIPHMVAAAALEFINRHVDVGSKFVGLKFRRKRVVRVPTTALRFSDGWVLSLARHRESHSATAPAWHGLPVLLWGFKAPVAFDVGQCAAVKLAVA